VGGINPAILIRNEMNWRNFLFWLASGITFIIYGFDKAIAKAGRWRVPEIALHGLALSGGFACQFEYRPFL
jgi:uncharacterized membrane protein YsdA (DUF1294 family)